MLASRHALLGVVAVGSAMGACLADFSYVADGGSTDGGAGGVLSTGGSAGAPVGGGDAGNGGVGAMGAGGSGGGGLITGEVTYVATIAECIESGTPSECESTPGAMWVDDSPLTRAYMRFEVDDTVAGKNINTVTLRVTVGDWMFASGGASGEPNESSRSTLPTCSSVLRASSSVRSRPIKEPWSCCKS